MNVIFVGKNAISYDRLSHEIISYNVIFHVFAMYLYTIFVTGGDHGNLTTEMDDPRSGLILSTERKNKGELKT